MARFQIGGFHRMHAAPGAKLSHTIARVGVLVAYAAAAAVRHGLIEREDLGPVCDAVPVQWWCGLRAMVIQAFINDVFGRASVALAALAVWRRSAIVSYVAIAVGTWGMTLYGFTWSAVGVLGGAMTLARLQGKWRQDREAEQEA